MNKTLSIPEWHRFALEGTKLPVKIPLMGYSMFPLVRYNRDIVTIIPLEQCPQVGDIVLFKNTKRDLYVVHRVWEIKDNIVLTWGDNCDAPDGWMPIEEILGKVVLIERGKKKIKPEPDKGVRWAIFWHKAGKGYRFYRYCRNRVAERIKKMLLRGNP